MNIGEAIRMASHTLQAAGIDDYALESNLLVASAIKRNHLQLILSQQEALPCHAERRLRKWVRVRSHRYPLSYILGDQPFSQMTLKVSDAVLIPRPETEELVERAFALLDKMSAAQVVDVGTGSGNIALALAHHAQVERVTAIDLSADALRVARHNARRYPEPARKIRWVHGDLLGPLLRGAGVDLIVANLPYVESAEWSALSPEVQREPRSALDGGSDGLKLIRKLIRQAPKILRPDGFLLLEIGYNQGKSVPQLLKRTGDWTDTVVFKDVSGHPRIVQTQKKD